MGLITQVKKGEKIVPINLRRQSDEEVDQGSGRDILLTESQDPLLSLQKPALRGRKTLVLDLDETLVHSSFKQPTSEEP